MNTNYGVGGSLSYPFYSLFILFILHKFLISITNITDVKLPDNYIESKLLPELFKL